MKKGKYNFSYPKLIHGYMELVSSLSFLSLVGIKGVKKTNHSLHAFESELLNLQQICIKIVLCYFRMCTD